MGYTYNCTLGPHNFAALKVVLLERLIYLFLYVVLERIFCYFEVLRLVIFCFFALLGL